MNIMGAACQLVDRKRTQVSLGDTDKRPPSPEVLDTPELLDTPLIFLLGDLVAPSAQKREGNVELRCNVRRIQ